MHCRRRNITQSLLHIPQRVCKSPKSSNILHNISLKVAVVYYQYYSLPYGPQKTLIRKLTVHTIRSTLSSNRNRRRNVVRITHVYFLCVYFSELVKISFIKSLLDYKNIFALQACKACISPLPVNMSKVRVDLALTINSLILCIWQILIFVRESGHQELCNISYFPEWTAQIIINIRRYQTQETVHQFQTGF